jgi:hypothetical protein
MRTVSQSKPNLHTRIILHNVISGLVRIPVRTRAIDTRDIH